jgi:hypothetical protein
MMGTGRPSRRRVLFAIPLLAGLGNLAFLERGALAAPVLPPHWVQYYHQNRPYVSALPSFIRCSPLSHGLITPWAWQYVNQVDGRRQWEFPVETSASQPQLQSPPQSQASQPGGPQPEQQQLAPVDPYSHGGDAEYGAQHAGGGGGARRWYTAQDEWGRVYYVETRTGVSTYERPREALEVRGPLPPAAQGKKCLDERHSTRVPPHINLFMLGRLDLCGADACRVV